MSTRSANERLLLLEGGKGRRAMVHMNHVIATQTRRRHERREMSFYYAAGFLVFLPLVALKRGAERMHGRVDPRKGSVLEETHAKLSAMLGFVFMA